MSSINCNDSIYCTDGFKRAVLKLRKKGSYKDIDSAICKALKDQPFESFQYRGTKLGGTVERPYVKLDVGGRSRYRLYYLAIFHNGKIYLGYIHPKTGSEGSSNTTDEGRTLILKEIISAIKENKLNKVVLKFDKVEFQP